MAERTVARQRASFPFDSFSVAMCAKGDEGNVFADELAMDESEVGSDYHVRLRGIGVKRMPSGRDVCVFIYPTRLQDAAGGLDLTPSASYTWISTSTGSSNHLP